MWYLFYFKYNSFEILTLVKYQMCKIEVRNDTHNEIMIAEKMKEKGITKNRGREGYRKGS